MLGERTEQKTVVAFLFVVGRPGCGKSTAIYQMLDSAQSRGWQTVRIKDYEILYEMFRADAAEHRFQGAAHGAFDVLDFSVLDEVLITLRDQALFHAHGETKKLVIIEFARDDYQKALEIFHDILNMNAYFLFVEASVDVCIQRIHQRIKNKRKQDNHYVSEEILRTYYCNDNRMFLFKELKERYGLKEQNIRSVENNTSYTAFMHEVNEFTNAVLSSTSVFAR